jgi:hypothetical protein
MRPYLKNNLKVKRAGVMVQAVASLSSKLKDVSSNFSTTKQKQKQKQKQKTLTI